MVSVVKIIREMRIRPVPPLTWWVGNAMRDWWLKQTGYLPQKRLHPKTNAQGTHCHAVYPDAMRPVIKKFVRKYFRGEQLDLFGGQQNLF